MRPVIAVLPFFLLLAAWPSCGGNLPTPDPSPSVLPPQPAEACDLEAVHLRDLKCSEWDSTYATRCKALDRHLAEEHQVVADHSCILRSSSCVEAEACQ